MRKLLSILTVVFLFALLSCSDNTTSPVNDQSSDQTGILVSDIPAEVEQVIEANSVTQLDFGQNSPFDWPPEFDNDFMANCEVYSVTLLWGDVLGLVSPDAVSTDWSGTLSVNGVTVVHPRATIDFEPEEDYIVEDDIPSSAEWVSHTSMDFDGITFLVFYRTDIVYIIAPTLTFATEPITLSFDFQQLKKFAQLYTIDNGRVLVVHSRQIWPGRCPGGFMEGTWTRDDNTDASGHFEAVWSDANGEPTGLLSGLFTTNNDGSRTISGWISGYYTDQVIAEFRGSWWYDDPSMCITCGSGHGRFRAYFRYSNETRLGGSMRGEFGAYGPTDIGVVEFPLRGVWQNFCPFDFESLGSSEIN